MSQYEQENDLGSGGGEVDDETMRNAWANAEQRRSTANEEPEEGEEGGGEGPQPWAKFSSGEADET